MRGTRGCAAAGIGAELIARPSVEMKVRRFTY
jgi:hypothetical protein